MSFKSTMLITGAVIALCTVGMATSYAAGPQSDAGVAASKFGTEAQKAVGADDTLTRGELRSAVSLNHVSDPARVLAAAKVDDREGHVIGPVKAVIQENDSATAINVDVGGWLGVGERVVSISADNFTYIASRDILVIDMSKAQIERLKPIRPAHGSD
ncbi:MAG: hypothetical protein WCA81_04945 [Rhizomicrobium sp.]